MAQWSHWWGMPGVDKVRTAVTIRAGASADARVAAAARVAGDEADDRVRLDDRLVADAVLWQMRSPA